jgi:signal transduction histidine kinase
MPLRSKLIIFAVVMFFLFSGLSVGSYFSLSAASWEAEESREELAKLALIESLEDSCIRLGDNPDIAGCAQACRGLEALREKHWDPEGRSRLDHLITLSRALLDGDGTVVPEQLESAVSELKASILARVRSELNSRHEPTHRRAVRLLVASCLLTLGGAGTFAWLYSKLVRERKALEERVHRSERLAALGTLAAGIAHEINNPLATISVSAEALAERITGGPDEFGYLSAIEEEALRCRDIVGDLSDLARGGSLDREPVDTRVLVDDAVRIIERASTLPPAQVKNRVPDDLPLVSADRGKLLQILVNLIRNGVEASGTGGKITVTARISGGILSLSVADNGRGIPPERLDRIFDPFYTDRETGVGLGLSLCHRIAELHGGRLTAQSGGVNRGSTFILKVPVEGDDAD